jgi:L-fucose mutarotase/ribose pyranase (RbsD/FucU family)
MSNNVVKLTVLSIAVLLTGCTSVNWKATLDKRLPEYGHRNWIVIADSAYPRQSAAGIETIYTGAGQLEVLQQVLAAVDNADHVQPIIMLDAELESVPEADAPGVDAYRAELKQLLGDRPVKAMTHEDIIRKLDEASKLFNVLLLKTDLTIPYTSVFIELDCGYWGPKKEQKLRNIINTKR